VLILLFLDTEDASEGETGKKDREFTGIKEQYVITMYPTFFIGNVLCIYIINFCGVIRTLWSCQFSETQECHIDTGVALVHKSVDKLTLSMIVNSYCGLGITVMMLLIFRTVSFLKLVTSQRSIKNTVSNK